MHSTSPEGFEVEVLPGPVRHTPGAVRLFAEKARSDLAQRLFTQHGYVPLCAFVFVPWMDGLRTTNWIAPRVTGDEVVGKFAARLEQFVTASKAYAVLVLFESWVVFTQGAPLPRRGVSLEHVPGRREGVYCTLCIRGQRDAAWLALIDRNPDHLGAFRSPQEVFGTSKIAEIGGRFVGWWPPSN